MRHAPVITCIAAALAALYPAFAQPREGGEHDASLSVTGDARIAVALDGRGVLREISAGPAKLGLRWPGADGTEFLGSCHFVLRYRLDGRGAPVVLTQQLFEPALTGSGVARFSEGCAGGLRGPAPEGDDDGDGAVDEDPFDALDNDGDGAVDEDFDAAGHDMLITRADSRRGGLSICQSCYRWDFGHVRDFLGFKTTIVYAPPRPQDRPLRLVEAALVSGFRIGDPDDERRGANDRYRHIGVAPQGSKERPRYAAAFARDQHGPAAALVVLAASGPNGEPLGAEVSIVPASIAADSLWEASARAGASPVLGPDGGRAVLTAEAEALSGRRYGTPPLVGEHLFVHRFGDGVDLRPGDAVTIEWAIVFGRDLASLMRAAARARETWEGMVLPGGGCCRWVVPARTARRISAEASLSPAWVLGERRTAAGLLLPPGLDEDVEWLAVGGRRVDSWEEVGGRIVSIVDEDLIDEGKPFAVEAQMTDGTILSGLIDADELSRTAGEDELAPGRLPEESLKLFPNPFVTSLTIDLLVEDPSIMAGQGAVRAGASSVRIYDVKGRLVRSVLEEEILAPGSYAASWDGTDETGAPVAPGVYYCKFQVGERSLTKRVILLR